VRLPNLAGVFINVFILIQLLRAVFELSLAFITSPYPALMYVSDNGARFIE